MQDPIPQPSYYQALVEGGLTLNQAKMYEIIVRQGKLPASHAARLANVPRTLGYKALQELQVLGLIEKEDALGKVATFSAAHPFKFKEIVDKRYGQAKDAKNAVEGVLSKLISDFNTRSGAPGLRILEGISGIAELYEDELNERQPIRLIRSPKDDDFPELKPLVQNQIKEQLRLNISVRVIAPLNPRTMYSLDKEFNIERRIIPPGEFAIPAQIAIYANKVAITSYELPLITTLIENVPIRQTFEILFEYIWKMCEPHHNESIKLLKDK